MHRTGVVRELGHFRGLCRVPTMVLPLAHYLLGNRHLIEAHRRDACAPSADPGGQHPEQDRSAAFLFPGSSVCHLLVAAICGRGVWGGTSSSPVQCPGWRFHPGPRSFLPLPLPCAVEARVETAQGTSGTLGTSPAGKGPCQCRETVGRCLIPLSLSSSAVKGGHRLCSDGLPGLRGCKGLVRAFSRED